MAFSSKLFGFAGRSISKLSDALKIISLNGNSVQLTVILFSVLTRPVVVSVNTFGRQWSTFTSLYSGQKIRVK